MGKFSGILLCTDFDNSLVCQLKMPQINVEAIKYFKQNGGLFSVISGRSQEVLGRIEPDAHPNTYLGLYNGTVVYDPTTCTATHEDFMKNICLEQMFELQRLYDDFVITVCASDKFVTIHSDDTNYRQRLKECEALRVRKYYVHREKNFEDDAYERICEMFAPDCEATRSSIKGVEIQNEGVNKASAALKIKELTGAKLLICLGDYENDISMVKAADVGYAVENACDKLKRVADRMTVHCKDGAIAAIIKDIESGKLNIPD